MTLQEILHVLADAVHVSDEVRGNIKAAIDALEGKQAEPAPQEPAPAPAQ